jgi:aromatic ring-opening dioxygenase catalytic subunit (LigB family)
MECAAPYYPEADVPVFQVSLDHNRTFAEHLQLGRELGQLRERGALILGSGNLVHNLHSIKWDMPESAYPWAEEFDAKVKYALDQRDINSLVAPDTWEQTCWRAPTQLSNITSQSCIASGAPTEMTKFPIPTKVLSLAALRCAWLALSAPPE